LPLYEDGVPQVVIQDCGLLRRDGNITHVSRSTRIRFGCSPFHNLLVSIARPGNLIPVPSTRKIGLISRMKRGFRLFFGPFALNSAGADVTIFRFRRMMFAPAIAILLPDPGSAR